MPYDYSSDIFIDKSGRAKGANPLTIASADATRALWRLFNKAGLKGGQGTAMDQYFSARQKALKLVAGGSQ